MRRLSRFSLLAPFALAAACTNGDKVRADSLQVVQAEQLQLMEQLAAQKDSLTNVVLDADKFIATVDSQISTVKGLPKSKRSAQPLESPIEEQLQNRREMLERVNALVTRTRQTAAQLAEARKREAALRGEADSLRGENARLQERIESDQRMITDLGETITRQTAQITGLQMQVDSIGTVMRTLGSTHYRAYYVVGTEKELLQKGIIEREGGANLLFVRLGRSLQPARLLDPSQFTAIDQRDIRDIPLPDSTRRYQIVSRQPLDAAQVAERDRATWRGALHIADADKFWGPSRYLIIVQR
jgi:regulator of replication initiation timing